MTDLRTAAQQALRALEQCGLDDTHRSYEFEHAARAALRAALAEPQDEPAAKCIDNICSEHLGRVEAFEYLPAGTSLYTHPAPQRQPQKPVVNQQMTTEPVAWMYPDDYERMTTSETFCNVFSVKCGNPTQGTTTVPLYTHPAPQRQPLPKHDQHCVDVPGYGLMATKLVRAVERAHGIGGQDGQG